MPLGEGAGRADVQAHLGYHPVLAFCDNTAEFLAASLRPGNAGINTAADHIAVLDQALALSSVRR